MSCHRAAVVRVLVHFVRREDQLLITTLGKSLYHQCWCRHCRDGGRVFISLILTKTLVIPPDTHTKKKLLPSRVCHTTHLPSPLPTSTLLFPCKEWEAFNLFSLCISLLLSFSLIPNLLCSFPPSLRWSRSQLCIRVRPVSSSDCSEC